MSDDIRDILGRLQTITEGKTTPAAVTKGLNPQQKSVKQMPALFQPKSIKVLGTKTDPKHPAAGYFVGGESQEEPAAKPSGIAKGLNRAGGRIATSAPESFRPVEEGGCNSTMEGVYCPKHGMNECGMSETAAVNEAQKQIDDYDRWLDLVNSQGASVHMQKNQTQAVAQNWSGDIIGEFNLRTNQGFIDSSYLGEAGPFSYGAKKPRKGSVADLAAKKRQEQERGRQPIEPRDQMVGVARVKKDVEEGISVVDQDYDLDQMHLTLNIEGKKVSFTYWDYDEDFSNAERRDVFDQLQEQPWYKGLDHPTKMEILDAAYRAIRGLEPQEYRPTVGDEPLDEQGVAEAFNQPYSTDLEKSEHDDYDALVQLPDGSYLSIMFNKEGEGKYQVEFWRGPSQEITGEGDSQRIFATVLNAIQKFIKEHKPQQLTFGAAKAVEPGQKRESRAKLYNRLVHRYAAAWGYNAIINDYGNGFSYELTRLKPNVAEEQLDELKASGFGGLPEGPRPDENGYYHYILFYLWPPSSTGSKRVRSKKLAPDRGTPEAEQFFKRALGGAKYAGHELYTGYKQRMQDIFRPRPNDKQGVAEGSGGRKFIEPNFDFEWEEAERYPEFAKLGKDAWIELARKGRAVAINSARGIDNTDAAEPDSFRSLVPAKQKRALAQLEKGTIEMPIIAVYSDGRKELVGGNTRLTAMMARDGRATVWAFRVPGEQGVAEGEENIVAVIDGVRSDRTYNDKDHAHNSLGKLVAYGKAKVAELYINGEKVEHFEIGKKYKDFEPKQLDSMAEGEITKTDTGLKHSAVGRYGGGTDDEFSRDFGKYARDLTSLNKDTTKKLDQAFGVKHQHGNAKDQDLDENLRKWFKEKWVRFGPDGKIKGDCARGDDSEGKPKCLPQSKAHALGKKGRASAAARKRREDPNPERTGKAINVATKRRADEDCWDGYEQQGMKKKGDRMVPNCVPVNEQLCPECGGQMFPITMINEKQDACYYKVKSRYKVWPSAYASGALVQCRKKGAKNWGDKSNESIAEDTTTEDVLSKMKQKLGDYLQDVATAIRKDPDLMNKLPKTTDTIGPAVRTLKTDDGHEIKIHGNEDDGFRVTIRNRPGPTRFASLDEASMAVEMYIAHRRQQELEEDYIEER